MKASEIRAAFFKWYADERTANRAMQYFPLGCEQRAFEQGARWALAQVHEWADELSPLVKRETILKRCKVEDD